MRVTSSLSRLRELSYALNQYIAYVNYIAELEEPLHVHGHLITFLKNHVGLLNQRASYGPGSGPSCDCTVIGYSIDYVLCLLNTYKAIQIYYCHLLSPTFHARSIVP